MVREPFSGSGLLIAFVAELKKQGRYQQDVY